MTDTKEISEAINVQELFEKSKIDFSKEYIKNLQESYDDGDLSLEELEDLIDSIKTVEKAFKKNKVNSSEIYVISLSQLYSDGELEDDELNDNEDKELLNLIAMFAAIAAMLPLMELLLTTKFFSNVAFALPNENTIVNSKKWRTNAIITIALAAVTYPFMTQLGHGLLPLPEDIFRMTIGNGFLSYLGLLTIISVVIFVVSRKSKKNTTTLYELGMTSPALPNRLNIKLVIRSLLLAICMTGMMYLIVVISNALFALDLRYIWPMFSTFNGFRIGQFFIYIWVYIVFYIFVNSKVMAGLRTKATYQKGFGGFMKNYLVSILLMCGGVFIITLIEYIPFFANIGPGADLLFGSTFGGPFMSLLILFLPQVMVYALLCTYAYRRTGNIYTGAFVAAILACWIVTGGSSFF